MSTFLTRLSLVVALLAMTAALIPISTSMQVENTSHSSPCKATMS